MHGLMSQESKMKLWIAVASWACVTFTTPVFAVAQARNWPREGPEKTNGGVGAQAPATAGAAQKAGDPDRRMQMTEAVSAADFKKIEGAPLLIAAYAIVWVVFFSALAFTFLRLRRLRADVARLEADLERSGGGV